LFCKCVTVLNSSAGYIKLIVVT